MLKNIRNIITIALVIGLFASCGSTKKVSTKGKPVADKATVARQEYNAFFKAETERIKGNKTKARDLYREFVKVHKTNAAAYYNLSKLEYATFRFNTAEIYAARSVELAPDNKHYLEFYGDVLSLNKKPKKAIEIYKKLTKLHADHAENYRYKMYRIYSNNNEYQDAYETLELLEKDWGMSSEISTQKIDLLLKQKREGAAIKEAKALMKFEPRNLEHKEKLASLYDKIGRKAEAKEVYDKLIDEAPNNTEILMRSSSYYLRNNDTVGFQRLVKRIIKNPKVDKSVRLSMILPLIEINNDSTYIQEEIVPIINSFQTSDDDDSESLKTAADILYTAKQFQPAANRYRQFLKQDQSKFGVWFNLMLSYSNLDMMDSVIQIAEESFDYFPNNAYTHYFKGTAHYQKKEYKECATSLENAIELEPDKQLKAQIFSLLGDTYNSLQDYTQADKNFDKALKINEDATTLNNYAYYLSVRNARLDDALKMSEKSLKLMPDAKTFLDTYGWILYKQGKYKKAKTYIERAIEGDGDADVLEHLGDIYYKLNDASKAKEYWQKAKKAGGGSEYLDKKIEDGKLYE